MKGGLTVSTLLTLFVIPVMYTLFDSKKQEVKARERISRVSVVDGEPSDWSSSTGRGRCASPRPMTEALISHIETFAAYAPVWGFFLILFFMTVESSFIPFPSEVVMIPAGFLAARGGLTFGSPLLDAAVAVLAGTAGSLAGAYINYFLAKRLGYPVLERYGKYFFLPKAKLERAQEVFRQYGAGATFVCRLLPAIRQLISIPAGLSNMKLTTFTVATGLGAGIWVVILTAVGYGIGAHTASMSYADLVHSGKDQISANLIYLIPTLLVGFGIYVWVSNRVMGKGK